jgi:hypothetical protein
MEGCFQEVSLPRIFAIKEFEESQDKGLIDIALRDVGIEVGTLDEAQEELVDDLEVGPGELKNRFIFLRVKGVTSRVYLGRYRTK